MNFKKWLNEDINVSTYLYGMAPEAKEYPQVTTSAQGIILFRDRMKNAKKTGHTLINIDLESLFKIPIISPKGSNLPDEIKSTWE